jgi:hypothetical protein
MSCIQTPLLNPFTRILHRVARNLLPFWSPASREIYRFGFVSCIWKIIAEVHPDYMVLPQQKDIIDDEVAFAASVADDGRHFPPIAISLKGLASKAAMYRSTFGKHERKIVMEVLDYLCWLQTTKS